MVDPQDEQTLNLEVDCLDELGRALSPEQSDDPQLPVDQTIPVPGHSCHRDSKPSELSASDFGIPEA
ncbi:hypothetical protein Pan258_46950 [Symmachiella dynata]|uniref:Uncharacterized protein n=1 Tax=Symmachiella dynata TaxID=2527995 RepID=A0A517ZUX3_9PLAN|nr:hypothetical protein [Symmachiella dynata]QDT50616.1 hypothetical protein Pan258_46950 [Symmachiella dynata]QDU46270.1 hypothetical protein Mal52_47880 [Symmachiella dynata]